LANSLCLKRASSSVSAAVENGKKQHECIGANTVLKVCTQLSFTADHSGVACRSPETSKPKCSTRTWHHHHPWIGRAQAGVAEGVQAIVRGSRLRIARRALQVQSVVIYQAYHCYRDLRSGSEAGSGNCDAIPPWPFQRTGSCGRLHVKTQMKQLPHLQQVPQQRGDAVEAPLRGRVQLVAVAAADMGW